MIITPTAYPIVSDPRVVNHAWFHNNPLSSGASLTFDFFNFDDLSEKPLFENQELWITSIMHGDHGRFASSQGFAIDHEAIAAFRAFVKTCLMPIEPRKWLCRLYCTSGFRFISNDQRSKAEESMHMHCYMEVSHQEIIKRFLSFIDIGRILMMNDQVTIDLRARAATLIEFEKLNCAVVNASDFQSEIGARLMDQSFTSSIFTGGKMIQMAIIYRYDNRSKKYLVSLRSRDDYVHSVIFGNCKEISMKWGGGGHFAAAAFSISDEELRAIGRTSVEGFLQSGYTPTQVKTAVDALRQVPFLI